MAAQFWWGSSNRRARTFTTDTGSADWGRDHRDAQAGDGGQTAMNTSVFPEIGYIGNDVYWKQPHR
jgi:hypothetical protein